MRIKSKILLPFSLVVFIFIVFYLIFRIAETRQINKIVLLKSKEQQNVFNNVIGLKYELYKSVVVEHRNSESLLKLINNKGASPHIDMHGEIENYDLSAIWIYDNSKSLVYSSFNKNLKLRIIPPVNAFELLDKQKEGHFYFITEAGIMEIIGSVIPSNTEKYKSINKHGYFYVGKLWDEAYVNNIEKIIDANLIIQKPNDKLAQPANVSEIITSSVLFDAKDQAVAKVLVDKKHVTLYELKNFNFYTSLYLIIFILVLLGIIIIAFQRFISFPLKRIELALNSEELNELKPLIKKKDEFGRISELIENFFKQRKQLFDEINDRKSIEEALRKSENKYKDLLDNIAHGVFRSSPEGKFIEVNNALVKLLGYSSEEDLMSINIINDFYFFPNQRKAYLNRLNSEGKLLNVELNVKCKDGQMLTSLLNAHIVKDIDGEILYYEGTITDISEYRNLKSHLRKLELAVSQSIDGIALIDKNRNFEYVNDSWAKMHGYKVEEFKCQNISFCHNKPEILIEDIEPVFEEMILNEKCNKEVRHVHKSGEVFLTSMSNSVIKDWGGNVIGYVIIASDLTDRIKKENEIKRLYNELEQKIFDQNKMLNDTNIHLHKTIENLEFKEKEITKSQQLYLTTINSSNEWIHYIDNDFKFVLVNEAMIRIHTTLGLETDLVGKNLKDIYSFLDKKVIDEYDYIFETGKELVTEEDIRFGDRIFNTETIKSPVYEKNKVVGVVTIIRDITERKEMERKILFAVLEAEEKEKKRFSEDLHDELGALLSTMKIYVNTILKKHTIVEAYELLIQLKEMIYEAVDNTRSIAFNLTPNILVDFGLVRAVKTYCDKINNSQDINIAFKAEEFYERLNKNLEVNIFRIIQELLSNSLKHSAARNININLEIKGKNLILVYSDDGKGFNKDKILSKNLNGIGINNIFARVKLLNGVCKIESDKGKGMFVEIEINDIS